MMRPPQGRQLTRLVSVLVATALIAGSGGAYAASRKGKAKSRSSSRAATPSAEAPASAASTESAPTAEATEKAAPSAVADPFAENSGGEAPHSASPAPSPPPPASSPRAIGAKPTDEPPVLAAPASGGGIIERLPADAFPQPYIRGLFGSSLWLTMHGLQWPYYPRTGIGVSGYAWIDSSYAKTRIGDVNQPDHLTRYIQEGRAVLRVTPTYSAGDWFAQAQVELVGTKEQAQTGVGLTAAGTDDVWVRAGRWNTFDVTVGRFEAFEIYHLGMGLDLNTFERVGAVDKNGVSVVPQFYGATYAFYRPNGPGNIAVHGYLSNSLRFELLGQWGNEAVNNTVNNTLGGRPALVFDVGWLKLKGAVEYVKATAQDPTLTGPSTSKRRGGSASAQLVFAPWIELGANFGKATFDVLDDNGVVADLSGDTLSYGAFATARPLAVVANLLIGAGWNETKTTSLVESGGAHNSTSNTQTFLAVQYLAGGQLFIKLVAGYARTSFSTPGQATGTYDNDQYSVRLRFQYLF